MPQRLNVLSDDSRPTSPAFRGPPFGPLGLALDAPGVAVLLNVRHAMLKGITALGTEEVTIVPVLTKGNNVLAQNRCLAMPATRGEELVPVKMAVEA